MEQLELEGLAVSFYERHDVDPAAPVSTFALARRAFGRDAITRTGALRGTRAATYVLDGRRRIAVHRAVPVEIALHLVGHEIAHAILDGVGYRDDDIEACCDLLGAALMAPQPAARRLVRACGDDFDELADAVGAAVTWAALRYGEATARPLVVVSKHRVWVRGAEWAWPPEATLRRIARTGHPGVRKVSIEARRVVLIAEDG